MDDVFNCIKQSHANQADNSTQFFPITQLFSSKGTVITRVELLKKFREVSENGLISKNTRNIVFSSASLLPEAILYPDKKVKLFKLQAIGECAKYTNSNFTSIDKLFKSEKEIKHFSVEELFEPKTAVIEKGEIGDLFNGQEKKRNIDDLLKEEVASDVREISRNREYGSINDLFEDGMEHKISPIDALFEKESSAKPLNPVSEEVADFPKPRSGVEQLFDNAIIYDDSSKALEKFKAVQESLNKKGPNPFLEYTENKAKESDKVWYYKDLKGNEQGPFSSFEMYQWNGANFLSESLPVRLQGESSYKPLNTILQPHGIHIQLNDLFGGTESKTVPNSTTSSKLSSLFT
eukprot:TRINITY_DN7996_c0_g3_i1.p1 TRINITY_DN7996_c0_g3~~TRINITY_DN7996_c0_g3_i1.p1  ORF type:complete len:349 (+),score=46.79 TRINITY_DN7996_c0_g3_i1:145-1191(+)